MKDWPWALGGFLVGGCGCWLNWRWGGVLLFAGVVMLLVGVCLHAERGDGRATT